MVTHYEVILWHNWTAFKAEFAKWNSSTLLFLGSRQNLLRTCGNWAANQRWHIVPGKSDIQASLIVILADVIQSGPSTCPNNLQSTYQSGMSDFRDIVEFCASTAVWFDFEYLSAGLAHLQARGRNFKLQLQTFFPKSNLCETLIEESKVAGGSNGQKVAHFKTSLYFIISPLVASDFGIKRHRYAFLRPREQAVGSTRHDLY